MSRQPDTVGEFPKQRTYAFCPAEFKGLTQLKLNSPTVSSAPKAHKSDIAPAATAPCPLALAEEASVSFDELSPRMAAIIATTKATAEVAHTQPRYGFTAS
jgi:hypothetical protein